MKKFVALLLAVLMVASLCACGQKDTQTGSDIKTVTAGKLTMSTNAQFPPYESVADDGKGYEGTGFEGIDIEIAYALAQKLGLELVVDDMDFDSALSAVQTGKSDIVAAGVTVTPERQNTMCFTDSYANGVQVVIVKEGSDIKSIDDLEGRRSAPSAAPPVIAIAPMITAKTALLRSMTAPPPCRICSPVRSTAS